MSKEKFKLSYCEFNEPITLRFPRSDDRGFSILTSGPVPFMETLEVTVEFDPGPCLVIINCIDKHDDGKMAETYIHVSHVRKMIKA